MKTPILSNAGNRQQGSALVIVFLSVTVLAGMSAALLAVNLASSREQQGEQSRTHARYVSQAGLTQSMFLLAQGDSANVGSAQHPTAFGTSSYWVVADQPSANITRMRATGSDGRSGASMELVVRSVPNTIWRYGAFGREFVHMDSNARVDSYNSTLGTYASQATNGSGSTAHALTNGDVGSNGDISIDQNAKVWGDSIAGPSRSTTVLGNAIVTGSTTPASTNVEMPTITVPTYTSYGSLGVTSNMTLPSSNRTYGALSINNNRTLTITGPANFVVSSLTMRSGSKIVVNATNGPVSIYVLDNFVMNSNTQFYSTDYKPQNVKLFLLSDNVINPEVTVQLDTVDFDSNSSIYGTIYAPTAAVTFDSNFELYGAILARSIDIDSNSRFHFDEALINATASGPPTFETICWRDIPLPD